MKTNDFIRSLRKSPNKALAFVSPEGALIHVGYHLTELKAASFDTVDCGGQKNQWLETIVQLWVPEDAAEGYMTAGKFMRIYDKVSGMIPLRSDAEIRFEYGDENFFPTNYHVEQVIEDASEIRVQLRPPQTTCKARDRSCAQECCA
jgi:hypothetical protein